MPTEKEFLAKKAELDLKQDKLTAGDNITINSSTNVISATDTTYSDVTGATSQTAGVHGLVPAPAAGDEGKFLKGDGTWDTVSAGSASLAGLTDVNLDNPTDGQALVYDAANQEWVNGEAGNTDYVELTQAEYNALTPEEQMNGTLYFITDGEGGGGSGGGGGGNVYGAFVDTNRVIQASTNLTGDDTYTAVEDCAVFVQANGNTNNSVRVLIDNAQVGGSWSPNIYGFVDTFYVKRGQTIRILATLTSDYGAYTVYGLTFGTQNIFTPQIYSTEERCVGVWIDNKPLYARTIIHTGALNSVSDWTLYDDSVSYDTLIRADVVRINTNGEITPNATTLESSPRFNTKVDHKLYYFTNYTITATYIYIALLYTKTTDTAGSGSYNTLGVPMVHIEDNVETVIGTYNGKPLYQMKTSFTVNTTQQMNGFYRGDADLSSIMPVDIDRVLETTSNMQNPNSASRGFVTSWYETDAQSLFYLCLFSTSGNMGHTTIKYTKTTD